MSWFTKIDEVEKVVVQTVLGTPKPVAMFCRYRFGGTYGLCKTSVYYHSRQQAMEECKEGDRVEPAMLWKVGDLYLRDIQVVSVAVRPEPKRVKGKARGSA